jgi:hypothetical protein
LNKESMMKIYFFIFVVLSAAGYWGGAKIGAQIGAYLIVYEKFENVEYLIANDLTLKVSEYVNSGRVKKVLVTVVDDPKGFWQALYSKDVDLKIRKKAEKLGIPQEQVLIYKNKFVGEIDRIIFYKHILKSLDAKSVLFFDTFYRTRTRRFFLNRYFEGLNIKTYVQYEKNIETKELKGWWKKTIYANLFLEQYLTMGFYYLNKILWTRAI